MKQKERDRGKQICNVNLSFESKWKKGKLEPNKSQTNSTKLKQNP